VSQRELTLGDTAVVGFKNFEPERFRGQEAGSNTLEAMTKIPPSLRAVVLGGHQVKRHHLIPHSRMPERALIGCLDLDPIMLAMDAQRPFGRPGIDLNALIPLDPLDPLDLKVRHAWNVSCVGHRYSPLN